jgi:resolvase-like protein
MGAGGGGRHKCAAAANWLTAIDLEGTRGTQNRDSHFCSNGDRNQPLWSNTMNESLKVQPHHLERSAYLYIRQSSMRQVLENVESTKRQYALRGRATALGWRDDQIIVIDNDQGESGASAAWREGFQRLVTDVGMGHAGIVMGLEVSRLARNNADWHRLLEICALADTLILDEDGVYDPTSFNDRLLLGLNRPDSQCTSCLTFFEIRSALVMWSHSLRRLRRSCESIATADIGHGLMCEGATEGSS